MPDIKEVVWRSGYGEGLYPFCPYCEEFAYEKDECVFCGKPFKWVDSPIKPTIVEEGGYTIVQPSNNHIQVYKDGKMFMYMSCTRKRTEEELKEIVRRYSNGNEN